MARSINDIKQEITDVYVAEMAAIGITITPSSWSRADLKRLMIYVFAFCAYVLELLFDTLKSDTDAAIKELKPHSLRWYANKAKAYQFGFPLLTDSDEFNNGTHTDAEVEASKLVKYSAVVEQQNNIGRVILRIKLASFNGTDLVPLATPVMNGVKAYFSRIKDAGVPLQIDSLPADQLKMKWKIFYDPLVLGDTGARLDGSDNAPVRTAIKQYLRDVEQGGRMPFNGTYILAHHIDFIQAVDGVVIPDVVEAYAKYGNLPFGAVDVMYEPDAGYLRFDQDSDLVIEYIAQNVI